MSNDSRSLYDQIGGEEVIDSFIDNFYERVLADPVLAPFFAKTSMKKQRVMQKEFFAAALGGPLNYSGADLAIAHQGRGITSRHLARFTEHLIATLQDNGIEEMHVNGIIARIATYSREILGDTNVDG
jgi:hemoglobin